MFQESAHRLTISLSGVKNRVRAGQTVTLRDKGHDRNGRLLAEVILPDGRSLNRELVRAGFAWWFRKYSSDQELARLEAEARAERRGLWADANPVAPWDYRRGKRP